ncbi:AUGMIN subunit 5 isoform X2 [Physcomitrium patens]|uniref:AUGMIN subunit 5 isoform X2 n=1 Tax=Physcomitrium patens TaxID=3218 RepID=UPI000D17C5B7|nr:AUGMIN subunit 5-like isoform X2 [Physcomitrium patens]|eukprot:XP_024396569.1 AUGMIN subunit 5-like isoform X2 [Physcomitrella patens]
MQSDGSIQAETILKWLQQEMGYQNPPSVDFLRRICRGNMISVWNFLLERVKSEKTNEMIRRNFVIHGTKIPSTVIPIDESLKVKHGAAESKKEVLEDRSKTHKNDREVFRRDGTLVKSTPAREKRSRSSARTLIKDLPEKERQVDRVLQSEGAEDSREMAMRDRDVAMAEVGRLRVVIDRLVKETKSRMTDVTMEEGERQRVLDERSNSRHKQVLLESCMQRAEQTTRIFTEYSCRLQPYVEHAREAQRGKNVCSDLNPDFTPESTKVGQSANQLLTEIARDEAVRQACEALAEDLMHTIKTTFSAYGGERGNLDHTQLEVAKLGFEVDGDSIPEEVQETALTLLKNPHLLLQALAAHTSRIVAAIARETEDIDIRADAERLRYRFENNRVVEDVSGEVDDSLIGRRRSNRGTSKSSFRQLLERQKAHVQQFMATEDALNQVAQAKRMTNELIRRVRGTDAAPSATSSDVQNSGSLRQLELAVWARERELAGMRASVNTINSEVQRLQKMCEERRDAEESLQEKWKKIEEFDARRVELESIYTSLLRANTAAAASWEQHARVNKERSVITILPIFESAQNQASTARDLLEREVAAFQRIPDSRPYMMPATSQALLDARGAASNAGTQAIVAAERHADMLTAEAGIGDPSAVPTTCRISAALKHKSETADPGLASVLNSMRFFLRPGGSPGTALEDLAKTLNRVQTLRDLVGNGRELIAAADASTPKYERTATHCIAEAIKQEKVALEEWLPQLKLAVQDAQQCLEDCKRVRGLVEEWWEQPASTAVDWILVDGQNVAAWLAHVKQLQTVFYERLL